MTATSALSSSARRALRAAAHHLDPVVMVGQHGLTPAVLHEIDLALTAHALIKVRVMSDERETRVAFLNEICEKMGCESVQHLGKLLVLWRNAEGEAAADDDAEQDAASVKASKSGRGPRTKLPSEWANAEAPLGARSAAPLGARSAAPAGTRSASALPPGERRRYGEIPPAPRREGWAPKDRRGAARAGGEEALGTRRREEKDGFAAPRGRAPAYGDGVARGGAGGRGGYAGAGNSGGGSRFGNSGAGAPSGPPRSRSGYGGNTPAGGAGYGGGGGYDRSGGGGGSGYAGGGGGYNRGGAGGGTQGGGYGRSNEGGGAGNNAGAGAPRARWGDRREPSDGRSGGGSNSGTGGYGDRGGGGFSGDRRPAPTGGGFSARGGAGNRDGVTGKPSGFSRSGSGAGGGAPAPRTRRRMG